MSWEFVMEDWGSWRCWEKEFINCGHPFLTIYSNQEWSRELVAEEASFRGAGRVN